MMEIVQKITSTTITAKKLNKVNKLIEKKFVVANKKCK